ncbi:Ca-activated chloride channel homolog [Marchantia polymorpha subsp. ruderalis]|uniref:RING-type domain-containing protein n=2 Tax=Marchantia polymorpha TaxID=3197 RepID=A0AAF6BPY5_MARPO|nr:hypothetical protein MARPO_0060s0061 [Marchantia polymorpha]BBN14069.1 hypothetical protein Mp_6g08600 [Marchantia polymorpha subsp. ruderalis]|eukprot:PTQ36976.1 hypothetical protein MARPO_0060s0061 [Marchantia polymorpha]
MFVQTLSAWVSVRRSENNSGSTSPSPPLAANSGWRRARTLMGFNACTSAQRDPDDDPPFQPDVDAPSTEAAPEISAPEQALSQSSMSPSSIASTAPATPNRSPSRLNSIRSSIRMSRSTCAICLESMKAGQGQALFTAECSHTFHFSCIASNVRHGNLVCPVCRAKWKEVPWQAPVDYSPKDHIHRPSMSNGSLSRPSPRRSQHVPGSRHSPSSSPRRGTEDSLGEEEEEHRRVDPVLRILDESIANARGVRRIGPQEPNMFDDDEPLNSPSGNTERDGSEEPVEPVLYRVYEHGQAQEESSSQSPNEDNQEGATVEEQARSVVPEINARGYPEVEEQVRSVVPEINVRGYPEVDEVSGSEERQTFTVLVNIKSALINTRNPLDNEGWEWRDGMDGNGAEEARDAKLLLDPSSRAPLDLVTVLDISGSMAGTKLLLLKRAMEFVISNLSPSDRLSVVAFSSSARRLFPLRRMVEEGRQLALRCVDSLVSTGGTNIADGLRKGAKVLEDRRMRNPVASIMLLSDGQDTYTMSNRSHLLTPLSSSNSRGAIDYRRLVPGSIRHGFRYGQNSQIPVHTFGFGADHDAATMHSISEASGGTFSFIQTESAVQDAFAQCIGGLLSVVVQDAQVTMSAGAPGVQIRSIQAGSYESSIRDGGTQSLVKIGDLYAEEERDIMVDLQLPRAHRPTGESTNSPVMRLLRVSCSFRNPVTQAVTDGPFTDITINRPEFVDTASQTVRSEVDRQRSRIRIAQSIVDAGALADGGDISAAQEILITAKENLHGSPAFLAGDQLCVSLETELLEIQTRMANRQMYERSGRAYILSAQSSHFRQRATTRGDFSENHSREYQTPSMADMILRSQTLQSPRGTHPTASPSLPMSPTREPRRNHHTARSALSPSPSRMLHRGSGKVQDSHGHRDPSPSSRI